MALGRSYYSYTHSDSDFRNLATPSTKVFLSEIYTLSYLVCQCISSKNAAISSFFPIKKQMHTIYAFALEVNIN